MSKEMLSPRQLILATVFILAQITFVCAQTSTFTYQGRFTDGGTAANGAYDIQFKLFDGSGKQLGSTITNPSVIVSNGVFTVQLDYGSAAFPGADRFLELAVRTAGSGETYTVLSPRQQLSSTPYAIRAGSTTTADNAVTATTAAKADTATKADSATTADTATNATQLGGLAANQYVQTNDSRLTDARAPAAGSSNYIQNTNSQQAANFNINGNGTVAGTLSAGVVNAATQYNVGGSRVLTADTKNNTFAGFDTGTKMDKDGQNDSFFGIHAGAANTFGRANSFFGSFAGTGNTTGGANSFFGTDCGAHNTSGDENSFFGATAGESNENGIDNAFFGYFAGESNKTGSNNSYFGANAGAFATGASNAFFGGSAGMHTTGSEDSFFGKGAGSTNTTGLFNTLIGFSADVGSGNLLNATAIGANARVDQNNSLVLGGINGVNGGSDTKVGIGTTTPKSKLDVRGGNIFIAHPNSLIITSPNSACWLITVSNAGVLSTVSTACP